MTLGDLQQDIKSGTLKPIYVFYGDEIAIYDIYIKQMKKPVLSALSIAHVAKLLRGSSLLTQEPKIFKVVFPDEVFKEEIDWDKLRELLGNNTLIMIFHDLDKRTKFYKQFSEVLVSFDKLPRATVIKHLKAKIDLCDEYLNDLLDVCDGSYTLALLEIDKVLNFARDSNFDLAYKKLRVERIIRNPITYDFSLDFLRALLSRDTVLSCRVACDCRGASAVYILALVYGAFRQLILVQGLGSDKSNATERTGLTQWQVNNSLKYVGNYTMPELVDILEFVKKLDLGVKTGRYEQNMIVDLLVCGIIGGDRV